MRGFHCGDNPVATMPCSNPAGDDMPKQKTHKGAKKRFRITANGKVKHRSAGTSHRQSRVSQKRNRNLRGTSVLDANMWPAIHAALGKYSY